MPRVPMMPLNRLGGELLSSCRRWLKERGDSSLAEVMKEYGEDGDKEFPPFLLNEDDDVVGLEGVEYDAGLILIKAALALDVGMVRVKHLLTLPRGRL